MVAITSVVKSNLQVMIVKIAKIMIETVGIPRLSTFFMMQSQEHSTKQYVG